MERILRLSDGRTIEDAQEIDLLLAGRRSIFEQRRTTPPPLVLKDFDLNRATLSQRERILVGNLASSYGRVEGFIDEPGKFSNPLFEIPDITIDLTPEAEDSPRKIMGFELSGGGRKITFDVLFNEQVGEYSKHYGNESETERIASAHLSSLLQEINEVNWQRGFFDAWSVVK